MDRRLPTRQGRWPEVRGRGKGRIWDGASGERDAGPDAGGGPEERERSQGWTQTPAGLGGSKNKARFQLGDALQQLRPRDAAAGERTPRLSVTWDSSPAACVASPPGFPQPRPRPAEKSGWRLGAEGAEREDCLSFRANPVTLQRAGNAVERAASPNSGSSSHNNDSVQLSRPFMPGSQLSLVTGLQGRD